MTEHVLRPNVTKIIKKLEDQVKVRFFEEMKLEKDSEKEIKSCKLISWFGFMAYQPL